MIGLGSNLLVRDGGHAGRRDPARQGLSGHRDRADGVRVRAGAGRAGREGRPGGRGGRHRRPVFLRGIPGAIGGALRMNGGAYGGETKDVLVEARGVDRPGAPSRFTNAEMGFTYRHSARAG